MWRPYRVCDITAQYPAWQDIDVFSFNHRISPAYKILYSLYSHSCHLSCLPVNDGYTETVKDLPSRMTGASHSHHRHNLLKKFLRTWASCSLVTLPTLLRAIWQSSPSNFEERTKFMGAKLYHRSIYGLVTRAGHRSAWRGSAKNNTFNPQEIISTNRPIVFRAMM